MKKLLMVLLVAVTGFEMNAQATNRGIVFFHGTWEEAVTKAKVENKLIFIDFYTQWCGPCLAMAEDVFTESFIGTFYNSNFVNLKIDAENGEGVELAGRFAVYSYPTYAFVDPITGKVVHNSKSRQSAEQFLATGEGALKPELRSGFLLDEFTKGRSDKTFLVNYINYNASVYNREPVAAAFDLLVTSGNKLTDPAVWEIFTDHITGYDNKYFKEVAKEYGRFVSVFGKEVVDMKLAKETRNCPLKVLETLPDFEGKQLNRDMIEINLLVREKKYDQADLAIRRVMVDEMINRQQFIDQFKFTVRGSYWDPETPVEWLRRCASYLQFIAYNNTNRQDAYIHQEYAAMLERLIRLTPGVEKTFPESVIKLPDSGVKEYNMRPRNLAQKPKRK